MKAKIILLRDVPGLGKKGTVAEVAVGFARNKLIPEGLAQIANDAAIKNLTYNIDQADKRSAKAKVRADEVKCKIEAKSISIHAKAGPSGTLFGAITSDMISKAVKREFNVLVDKKSLHITDPIKSTGMHKIHLKLHHDVIADLKIEVVAQDK
jgi:large subunit ribosomal protein L9